MSTSQQRKVWAHMMCEPKKMITRFFLGKKKISVAAGTGEAWSSLSCVLQSFKYPVRDVGGYHCRAITGGEGPSLHSGGIATDVNPLENPYGRKFITDMPHDMVVSVKKIRTKNGKQVFRWLGDGWQMKDGTWRYDTMHYEIACSPDDLETGIDWDTVAMPAKDPLDPSTWPICQRGDRGPTVGQLQRMLRIPADERFGAATERAVAVFQRTRSLSVDHAVGFYTWAKLLAGEMAVPPEAVNPAEIRATRAEEPVELEKAIQPGALDPVNETVNTVTITTEHADNESEPVLIPVETKEPNLTPAPAPTQPQIIIKEVEVPGEAIDGEQIKNAVLEALREAPVKTKRIIEEVPLPAKPAVWSRINWVAVTMVFVGLADQLYRDPIISQTLGRYPVLFSVLGVVFIYLRGLTDRPVRYPGDKPE